MINGTLFDFRISIDSIVCGFKPSLMSTTKIAISANEPPRFLKEVKAACPGVSIASNPGTVKFILRASNNFPQIFLIVFMGIIDTPIA